MRGLLARLAEAQVTEREFEDMMGASGLIALALIAVSFLAAVVSGVAHVSFMAAVAIVLSTIGAVLVAGFFLGKWMRSKGAM